MKKGQALVVLLLFAVIALTIAIGSVAIVVTNTTASEKVEIGTDAYYVAESGMENAMLRLLRDPTYTGETLPVGDGSAAISITGSGSPLTVTSIGTVGNSVRKIQVSVSYTNNVLIINSWKEIY